MTLTKAQRAQIKQMFGGKCAYCGCELNGKWHVDHVEAVVRCYSYGQMVDHGNGMTSYQSYGDGKKKIERLANPDGDRKKNLWPSCIACNINKSSTSLESWRKFLTDGPESLASYNGRFRHMLRFGIVTINPTPLLFWFEKCAATTASNGGAQ